MHIWVDADACPAVIKDILYRVAERTKLPVTLVANQWLKTPPYPSLRSVQVPKASTWLTTTSSSRPSPATSS